MTVFVSFNSVSTGRERMLLYSFAQGTGQPATLTKSNPPKSEEAVYGEYGKFGYGSLKSFFISQPFS